ncbi:hypothetical protein F7734_59885 [Scytonema sp. UIC 10036]|uniref:hypothetical protein n=1 Tax=Scytonema sp. UIC 10036 TaxID=2304196 RepID=UPI0012DAE60E|nr:hypothetical protein [Scytonema sp. UIC 10036]MUH01789.1 hypothetical protein [Scytonema sp. UIC 10036]
MQSALRIETKVLPGNKIEINLPSETVSDSVGQTVEVIIILPEKPKLSRQNILEWIEQVRSNLIAKAKNTNHSTGAAQERPY